jgi:hypothetical protein
MASDIGKAAHVAGDRAADHPGRERCRDGDHGAYRDVDAARGDHQRHAERHQHQRRRAVQDVDEAAVEMAVAPFEVQEAGVEGGVDCEQ